MTLDQLAISAGVTKGFLSRVERDETSPSVATLVTLCEVLNIEVGILFSTPDVQLVSRMAAPHINLGGTGVTEYLMTPRSEAAVQVVHSVIEPGGHGGADLYTINCEREVLYVLKGSVELVLADRVQPLNTGDAITFPGGEPHTWRNRSKTRGAEVIWTLLPAPWSGSA